MPKSNRTPEAIAEYRRKWHENTDAPYGYCWCMCGNPTPIARQSDSAKGYVNGQPKRFIQGHNYKRPYERGDFSYTVEDHGYTTPCWVFHRKGMRGYAHTKVEDQQISVHRYFYEQAHGPVSRRLDIDHLCAPYGGPRNCVRPEHLEPVTRTENTRRGRRATLTIPQVKAIRALYAEGVMAREIATRLGLKPSTVQDVAKDRTWRNV